MSTTTTVDHIRASSLDLGDGAQRAGPTAPEATPNSKPRKQSKRHVDFVARVPSPPRPSGSASTDPSSSTTTRTPPRPTRNQSLSPTKRGLLLSPHHANPQADWIAPSPSHRLPHPLSLSLSASATPYEPPRERFTPPREVLCESPTKPRAQRRKSERRLASAGKATTKIKKEPPVIDLSRPLPPPSPTDDPLLLSGPPRRRRARARAGETRGGRGVQVDEGEDEDPFVEGLSGSAHSYARDTPLLLSSPPRAHEEVHARLPELVRGQDHPVRDCYWLQRT